MCTPSGPPAPSFIVCAAVLLVAASCAPGPKYWTRNPEHFRVSAHAYRTEPVFLSPGSRLPERYPIQIRFENNSRLPLKFARWEAGRWVGTGLVVAVDVVPSRVLDLLTGDTLILPEPIGTFTIDYENVSGIVLWSLDDAGDDRPVEVHFEPNGSVFQLCAIGSVETKVTVTWSFQDKHGRQVGPTRTASWNPVLLFIRHEEPVGDDHVGL